MMTTRIDPMNWTTTLIIAAVVAVIFMIKKIRQISAKDALEKLKTQKVNFLLSDLYMPNMDGIELTKQVRAMNQYRCMPILILTTETLITRKNEGQAAGVSGWFVKPFEAAQLIKVIKRLMP